MIRLQQEIAFFITEFMKSKWSFDVSQSFCLLGLFIHSYQHGCEQKREVGHTKLGLFHSTNCCLLTHVSSASQSCIRKLLNLFSAFLQIVHNEFLISVCMTWE